MSEAIIVALISSGLTLVGTVITVIATSISTMRRTEQQLRSSQAITEQQLRISQAVTDTKLDELTRQVRECNNFGQRMPVVEEQIKVINHRISDLEKERIKS